VGGTRSEIAALLDSYRAAGYRRIVALRGDLPSGMATAGDFRYAAELVRFIREHSGDHFHVEVAAYPETHPQADDALRDLHHFKAKIDAGANGAITQYFFNADAYFRFVEDVRRLGVNVPIVPGIMPIANYSQLKRFSDMCGAEIPRWIAKRMQAHGDDAASVRALGAEVVAQLCRRLLEGGAPGLHFYTLNRARATQAVLQQLS
jgi:methylenetetrahydrofolate reductase (NADPH)